MRYFICKLPFNNPSWCREPALETIKLGDYVPVWTGEVEHDPAYEIEHTLEHLFLDFNMNIPEHYAASSMSVGDLVGLTIGEDVRYFICAGIGWKEVKICTD